MILAFALMAFDMFGQQIARTGDVTKDGVDEIVVTDPIGDLVKPREGRVLVIDPMKWSIVRELTGDTGETQFGRLCSVARVDGHSFMAVTSYGPGKDVACLRLIDANDFSTVWMDEIDLLSTHERAFPNPLCMIEPDGPTVFLCSRSIATPKDAEHLVLWRRNLKGRTIVGRLRDGYLPEGGQNLSPHYDGAGKLDGMFVSSIDGYWPPTTSDEFNGASRIDWVGLSDGASSTFVSADAEAPTVGIQVLPSAKDRGRLSGDYVALGRTSSHGVRIHTLVGAGVSSTLDFPDNGGRELLGSSMCWIRDIDGDGAQDLAIGCPQSFEGNLVIVGSKADEPKLVVRPTLQSGGEAKHAGEFAWKFGTQVCSIPDQDADGHEDLLVAATSPGGAAMNPAAVSVVSTKTWEVVRVVFERDLAKPKSSK